MPSSYSATSGTSSSRAVTGPDGHSLIYGHHEGRIWTIDTHTWQARGRPLATHAGAIRSADLSPGGHLLVTTSNDGTARLWDVASGRPIGAALPGARGNVVGAAFTSQPGGLAVVNERGGYIWDVRPSS